MKCALLAAVAGALVASAPALGAAPPVGAGKGERLPLKAYATITPTVHLFGDAVTARLAIIADTTKIDPSRLHVAVAFEPYRPVHRSVLRLTVGSIEQVTWTWTLRCLTQPCVPHRPPSDKYRVFEFQRAHIEYLDAAGRKVFAIAATWPPVEVLSQVSPGVVAYLAKARRLNWQFHVTPVASPTYRVSPGLLFWVALGAGIALLLAVPPLGWRWYRAVRPPPVVVAAPPAPTTPLDRALAFLTWAHARGEETLERKALERVADELVADGAGPDADTLSRTARHLAWSPEVPEDEELETLAERARETGHAAAAEPEAQAEAEAEEISE